MMNSIDQNELKKIETNKFLFSLFKCDHFDISTVLKILDVDTLPIDIPTNNNQVFIRDISNFIVRNNLDLKPNIYK